MTDAKGNSITSQYSSAYAGSLATTVTNALGQSATAVYDFNTGQKTSATDANGKTTTWSYDSLGRTISVIKPQVYPGTSIHAQTSFCYNDTAGQCRSDSTQNSLMVTDTISPTTSVQADVQVDGFGRKTLQRLLSDPDGITYTYTTYDALGHVYQTWNPSRCNLSGGPTSCTGESTFGITTHYYDAINREVLTVPPDGTTSSNNVRTVYNGNQTTVIDQAGVSRTSTVDALGRLTQVSEDNMGWITQYQYDTLGNLLCVEQHGGLSGTGCASSPSSDASSPWRIRRFTYDSLSRLLTSKNPETGLISYSYVDGSGQLCSGDVSVPCSKTDANSVTTTYTFDTLNRVIRRAFSDSTPTATYGYDGNDDQGVSLSAQGFSVSNPVGRMTLMKTASGTGEILSYDEGGRTASSYLLFPGRSWMQGPQAQYDLANDLLQLQYPDGRIVQQGFNAAGRLTSVADATGGSVTTTYFSGAHYSPAGALATGQIGNYVTQSFGFNSRLQTCYSTANSSVLTALSGMGNLYDRNTSFGTDTGTSGSNYSSATVCGVQPGNDGNVRAVIDNLRPVWSQVFTYDGVSRLTSAVRRDNGYNQQYSYDPYGNMQLEDYVQTNPYAAATFDPATNRLVSQGITYDAAGRTVTMPNGTGGGAGGMTYLGYTAEGNVARLSSQAGNAGDLAQYTYDASDERVYKATPAGTTSYVYFGGQVLAELDQNGVWTDYIYAGGAKVARVVSAEGLLQVTASTGGNWQWYDLGVGHGYVIQAGDRLAWRQYGTGGAHGGMLVTTAAGGNSAWSLADANGQMSNSSANTNQWESRVVDLTPLAGGAVNYLGVGLDTTTSGAGVLDFADIALVRADGSVTTIFNGTAQGTLGPPRNTWPPVANVFTAGYTTGTAGTAAQEQAANAHYYLDDHLGTTQVELASGGWPLWQGQFTPFGAEIVGGSETYMLGQQPADGTNNHYKFTGKERDNETGLDYFGARFYFSATGRWTVPDWSYKAEPVPYAKLNNPQSLNLYAYAQGNAETLADHDGHLVTPEQLWAGHWGSSGGEALAAALESAMMSAIAVDPTANQGAKTTTTTATAPPMATDATASSMTNSADDADASEAEAPAQQNAANKATVTVKKDVYSNKSIHPGNNGASLQLEAFVSGGNYVAYNWKQMVTRTSGGETKGPFNDAAPDTGLYWGAKDQSAAMADAAKNGGSTYFVDSPDFFGGVSGTWHANLSLIGIDKSGGQTVLWSTSWGFSVKGATGTVTLDPLTGKVQ